MLPPKIGNKASMSTLATAIQHCTRGSSQWNVENKGRKGGRNGGRKGRRQVWFRFTNNQSQERTPTAWKQQKSSLCQSPKIGPNTYAHFTLAWSVTNAWIQWRRTHYHSTSCKKWIYKLQRGSMGQTKDRIHSEPVLQDSRKLPEVDGVLTVHAPPAQQLRDPERPPALGYIPQGPCDTLGKACSTLLLIREMEIENTTKYHYTSAQISTLKNRNDTKCCWRCRKTRTYICCWWRCELVQPVWKSVCLFLKMLKINLPSDSATSVLGTYSREMKTHFHTKACTQMFITKLSIHPTTWINFKIVVLSERSPTQKAIYVSIYTKCPEKTNL